MLSVTLNIIGIILILYSIYTINKDISSKNKLSEDQYLPDEKTREYYGLKEDVTQDYNNGFDDVMESKLDKIDNEKIINNKRLEETSSIIEKSIIKDNRKINSKGNTNSLYQKIIELKTIGLTNEEIAKNLNKGIREVEIVLKMYNNRNQ